MSLLLSLDLHTGARGRGSMCALMPIRPLLSCKTGTLHILWSGAAFLVLFRHTNGDIAFACKIIYKIRRIGIHSNTNGLFVTTYQSVHNKPLQLHVLVAQHYQ